MSVKQRKNGRWEVRYRDPEGVHRSKSFRLKSEAIAFENTVRNSIYTGMYRNPINRKITVGEVFNEYIRSKKSLKPKSLEEIKSIWNHILSPAFGHKQISSISPSQIYRWIDDCLYGANSVTSANRINKALGYLNRIMDFAIELDYIFRNPILKSNGKQIKIKANENTSKRLTKALSRDELMKLAKHCGKYEDMVLLMGICGLRWAEVVGLKAKDFSPECRRLNICRTLSEIGGTFHQTTTKTDQERVIYIPEFLAEILTLRIQILEPEDLVFSNEKGNPISNSNFRTRVYIPAIKQANLQKFTIHDLRHTAASIAISNGADVVSVARMLGHSDTSMTLRRYSHFYDANLVKLSEQLNVIFQFPGERT